MVSVRVIDTNVLIGIRLKRHTHHRKAWDYIITEGGDVHVPPTAYREFDSLIDRVIGDLKDEMAAHRTRVDEEFGAFDSLSRDDLDRLMDQTIEGEWDVSDFLERFYNDIRAERVSIDPLEIDYQLGDILAEIGSDPCEEHGGWRTVVNIWNRGVDRYPSVRRQLNVAGNDLEITVEAHHISHNTPGETELASGDGDFLDHKGGEDVSRSDNILSNTNLDAVRDLRP